MKYTINVNPMGKPSIRVTRRGAFFSNKYNNYRQFIMLDKSYKHIPKLINTLQVKYFIEMPKSWSAKKKAEMINTPHMSKPDLSNLNKGLEDIVFQEDMQIHTHICSKYWSDKGRIEIDI